MSHTTLYVPYTASPRGSWNVHRNADVVGQFATRDEAMRHARTLTRSIRAQSGLAVDLKIEDETGTWRMADATD